MNLQAEKLEAVGDDPKEFYESFRDAIREVKSSLDGKVELKDAKTWLDELQD